MAVSTITPRVVLQDDTGTFVAPNNDGTPINNALFQTLQDRVDAIFPMLTISILRAEGFGGHTIHAGGSGYQSLSILNSAAGPSNRGGFGVGNEASAFRGSLYHTAGAFAAYPGSDVTVLQAEASGGLVLNSFGGTDRGIDLRTAGKPIVLRATEAPGFQVAVNGVPATGLATGITLTGKVPAAPHAVQAEGIAFQMVSDISGTVRAVGLDINPTLTGPNVYGTLLRAPTWTAGPHTFGATLSIAGPPTGTGDGAARYALEVTTGISALGSQVLVGDGANAAPAYSFRNATWTGMFLDPAGGDFGGGITFAAGTCPIAKFKRVAGTTNARIGMTAAEGGAPTEGLVFTAIRDTRFATGGDSLATFTVDHTAIYMPNMYVLTGANPVHHHSTGGLIRASSSARYKTAIRDLEVDDPLAVVAALRPRLYQDAKPLDDAGKRDWVGLVAEEVEDAVPALVGYNAEGTPENVMYDRVPVYLLLAVRQLASRLAALEARS